MISKWFVWAVTAFIYIRFNTHRWW